MTIEAILSAVAANIPADADNKSFSFYYGERAWQNLTSGEAVFPLMSVDFIKELDLKLNRSTFIGEKYPVNIYLGYKSELEWTTAQHEVEIQKATTAARNVLSQLQNYKDSSGNRIINSIEFNGKAQRVILRASDDVGTSGVQLPLLIDLAVDLSVCT